MPRDLARRRSSQNTESAMTEEKTSRARVTKEGPVNVGSGWSTDRAPRLRKTGGVNRFTYEEGKETLIKILEDVPFASYWQHWINKKPYTCLIDDCPLCNIGDQPKPVDCFNVVELGESGPSLFLWQCSANPSKAIKARSEKPRTSPVNKDGLYWAVTKVMPANGFPETNIDPVKEDELESDWGVQPLTPEQLTQFTADAYTKEGVTQSTPRHELVELANSLVD